MLQNPPGSPLFSATSRAFRQRHRNERVEPALERGSAPSPRAVRDPPRPVARLHRHHGAKDNASATLDAVRGKPLIFDHGRIPGAGAPSGPEPCPKFRLSQSPRRTRAHAYGRVSATMPGLPEGGPDGPPDGLFSRLPPGTDPPAGDGSAASKGSGDPGALGGGAGEAAGGRAMSHRAFTSALTSGLLGGSRTAGSAWQS